MTEWCAAYIGLKVADCNIGGFVSAVAVFIFNPPIAMGFSAETDSATSLEKAKALFALLDAADEEERLRGTTCKPRWIEAKGRATERDYDDGETYGALLEELDQVGALEGSWMQERWHDLKTRLDWSRGPNLPPGQNRG